MKVFLFIQQYFGNSIGCILILSYSSQVLPYWKEIKRVLLQITWEVCVTVRNGKQISRLKLLVLCSNPFCVRMKDARRYLVPTGTRLFDVLRKHQLQKTKHGIYLWKDYLRGFPPIVSLLVYLLASSNMYWRFYLKMSVVLVSCFKD